jgi:hypothetical protein
VLFALCLWYQHYDGIRHPGELISLPDIWKVVRGLSIGNHSLAGPSDRWMEFMISEASVS